MPQFRDSDICTVDYYTGRVISIGGLPWPPIRKAPMRAHIVVCSVIAVLLFVFVGLAQAKIVGFVQDRNGLINFHDEPGLCKAQALRAEFVGSDGTTVVGCWLPIPGGISVVFLDGDFFRLPASAIKPATAL